MSRAARIRARRALRSRESHEFTREFPDLHRRLEIYLAGLPPGVDPMTHHFDRVSPLLGRTAVFPMLSRPDPRLPNRPITEAGHLIGADIHESLHRFLMTTRPGADDTRELSNVVSARQIAQAKVRWHLAPDGYAGGPGEIPPPTPFRPSISQNFVMEGTFHFQDERQSGFHGFAIGRTFPTLVDGKPEIRLAAMVKVLEGYGCFFGVLGQVSINGVVEPPEVMRLAVVPSFLDCHGHLLTRHRIEALPSRPDPAPGELFFLLRGSIDPRDPMQILPQPRGLLLAPAQLPLRLLEADFQSTPRLLSQQTLGAEIGRFNSTFWIGPVSGGPQLPFQSLDSHYVLRDLDGRGLGELEADMIEGRARVTSIPGVEAPAYQFAGIGPITRGEGLFRGATGFITTIGVMTIFPRAMSITYIVRVVDPEGRYREATHRAWRDADREASSS